MPRTPKDTVKIRRVPKVGDTILVPVKVTRIGRNRHDTGDAITVQVPGFEYPVTAEAEYLLPDDD